jgi:hypothetical protein
MLQKLLLSLIVSVWAASYAQPQTAPQVVFANGQIYNLAGRDKVRQTDELIVFTPAFYQKNPPSNAGLDILLNKDGKVLEMRDRAGAVFLQNKPDPGPIDAKGKDGLILSGNGAARRWLLANVKVGDTVKIGPASAMGLANQAEVPPAAEIPCFPGAYYRKAASSFDAWTGIAGFITLGKPEVDEKRLGDDKQPLDNFSVYLGGSANGKQEVDAGLTWEFTVDEKGQKSARRNAFRPFWRVSGGGLSTWNNAPAQKEFYWYPGDTVQMAVIIAGPGKLRLVIADAAQPAKRVFQTEFDAPLFQSNVPRQFKRVNAIDQVRNEGKTVQPTAAKITGAAWLQTILLRGAGADAKQLPMNAQRFTDMRCPAAHAQVKTLDAAKGSEAIDILGKP